MRCEAACSASPRLKAGTRFQASKPRSAAAIASLISSTLARPSELIDLPVAGSNTGCRFE
jgi:hypothetical protein